MFIFAVSFRVGVLASLIFLKLMSDIVYQIFVFPPNDSPSKTMIFFFYFIKKALFVFSIFKFFFPSFPYFPDTKGQMEVE